MPRWDSGCEWEALWSLFHGRDERSFTSSSSLSSSCKLMNTKENWSRRICEPVCLLRIPRMFPWTDSISFFVLSNISLFVQLNWVFLSLLFFDSWSPPPLRHAFPNVCVLYGPRMNRPQDILSSNSLSRSVNLVSAILGVVASVSCFVRRVVPLVKKAWNVKKFRVWHPAEASSLLALLWSQVCSVGVQMCFPGARHFEVIRGTRCQTVTLRRALQVIEFNMWKRTFEGDWSW